MDIHGISQGGRIAAVGGLALFISLFLPWFGDVSGWEGQSSTDVYMLITAAVAVAAAVGVGIALPGVSLNGAAALLGGVATILLLWLIIFDFPEGADRGIGIFIALVAAAAIAYGGHEAAD